MACALQSLTMRRLLQNEAFQSVLGVLLLAPLAIWGLLVPDAPRWVKACAGVICVLALLAPALPFLALLPWHFIAVHRGLVSRSDQRRTEASHSLSSLRVTSAAIANANGIAVAT